MTEIVVAIANSNSSIPPIAAALARIQSAVVHRIAPVEGDAAELLRSLANPEVALAVIADASSSEAEWSAAENAAKPIVLVRGGVGAKTFSRVLVPLDGSRTSADAVKEAVRLFADAGVEIVVLHVFDPTNVPSHWDQAAHARPAWEEEFLARYCPRGGAQLRLRSGIPGEEVVSVAAAEHADLIVLGWSQHLDAGRARTVRRTVREAGMPVMLVPTAATGPRRSRVRPSGRATEGSDR